MRVLNEVTIELLSIIIEQNELRIGYFSNHAQKGANSEDHASAHNHSAAHMMHCFDYLRQALMCSADTTLERLQSGSEGLLPSVDGWGTTHECRDFQQVSSWARTNRASPAGGIL